MKSRLKTIAKAAVLSSAGLFASKLLTYGYRALIARFGGPEIYGQLSQAMAAVSLVISISVLGTDEALQKYVSESLEDANFSRLKGAVVSALQITLPVSVLGSVGLFLLADPLAQLAFSSRGMAEALRVVAFIPPFAVISKISVETTVGFSKVRYSVLVNNVFQNLAQVLMAAVLLFSGFKLFAATGSLLLGHVLSSLLAIYLMEFRVGPVLRQGEEADLMRREMIRFGYPLMFSGMVGTMLGYSDIFFLGYFLDDAAVGIYNTALPTAALIGLPSAALGRLMLPSLSAAEKSGEDTSGLATNFTRWVFYLSFPIFTVLFLFGGPVLRLLFGPPYGQASQVLSILVLGNIVGAATGPVGDLLKSQSLTGVVMKNSVGHLALNLLLNLLLVPRFGILGAAAATTLSVIVLDAVLVYEAISKVGVNPYSRNLVKPVFASIPGVVLAWPVLNLAFDTVPMWALIPAGLFYATSYPAFLSVLKGFEDEDAEIIVSAFRKIGREKIGEKIAGILVR